MTDRSRGGRDDRDEGTRDRGTGDVATGDAGTAGREDGDEADPAAIDPVAAYDRIAEHFASTREYPWPEVTTFVSERSPGGVALDLGCGNGRHAELLAERVDRVVGVDASAGVLSVARERAAARGFALELLRADAATLPLRSGTFDVAVYVATIHHLRPRERRVRSLEELARVLAPGGTALVSAWSVRHDRFDADAGFDTVVDWTLPGGETVPRYYHIYDTAEFRADLSASDLAVHETFVASGNCYAVVAAE